MGREAGGRGLGVKGRNLYLVLDTYSGIGTIRSVNHEKKDPAAVKLGRKGGKAAGGKGAAKKWAAMTAEERSEHNRQVAIKGWATRQKKDK